MTNALHHEPLAARARSAWRLIRGRPAEETPAPSCLEPHDTESIQDDPDRVGDGTPARPSGTDDPERLIDLAERAYKEVLDATKHQDDKVGRFLTAIAFLTTGAIALIASGSALRREFDVPGGGEHPLLAWSTGGFFTLTLAAVALLLLCLSVPVRLPKTHDDPMMKSHLFYSYIANRPRDEWIRHWSITDRAALDDAIAEDYSREAHNLAERTSAKYRHSYEASWLFVCALLFLGVSVYLRVIAEFEPDVDVALDFDDGYLIGLAVIASFHAALQIYTRWVHDVRSIERARDYADRDRPPTSITENATAAETKAVMVFNRNVATYRQRRWTLALLVPTTVFSIVVALPIGESRCAMTAALAVILLATLIPTWLTRQVWNSDADAKFRRRDPKSWWFPAFATVASVVVAYAAIEVGGVWRVVVIILPPMITGVVNLSRPAHSSVLARRLQRKSPRSATSA